MSRIHIQMVLLTCLFCITTTCWSDQKILVVHSYHEAFEWVNLTNKGIERALPPSGYELKIHYMDTKRRSDDAWKIRAGAEALRVCRAYAPDIVITCDDNAQAFFASKLSKEPDSPPIVFCGVNGEPKDYGYPNEHVTGILERPHVTATLRLAQSLKPSIRRVTVLTDESETSKQIIHYCNSLKMPVVITQYVQTDHFQQWQAMVNQANKDSDAILVMLYHTVKANSLESQSMEPSEVMKWTAQNSQIPVLGLYPFALEDGAVLTVSASPMEHGYMAAKVAMDLLRTKMQPGQFPINTAVEGIIMFNLPAARRHNIQIPPHMLKMARQIIDEPGSQQAVRPNKSMP